MTVRQCAHRACDCEIGNTGSSFCSVSCEQDAKGVPGEEGLAGCRCGHAGCGSMDEPADEDLEQHV